MEEVEVEVEEVSTAVIGVEHRSRSIEGLSLEINPENVILKMWIGESAHL